jgi:hypothetical protein
MKFGQPSLLCLSSAVKQIDVEAMTTIDILRPYRAIQKRLKTGRFAVLSQPVDHHQRWSGLATRICPDATSTRLCMQSWF